MNETAERLETRKLRRGLAGGTLVSGAQQRDGLEIRRGLGGPQCWHSSSSRRRWQRSEPRRGDFSRGQHADWSHQKHPQHLRAHDGDILNTSARTTVVASERISNLVTNLKQFSHLDEAELQIDDVAEGIESTLMLLRPQLAPGIDIRKELAELPKIECYASELNQCFMTLLVNASDALDGEGSITIKTSADDAGIFIETSDTGRGILRREARQPLRDHVQPSGAARPAG